MESVRDQETDFEHCFDERLRVSQFQSHRDCNKQQTITTTTTTRLHYTVGPGARSSGTLQGVMREITGGKLFHAVWGTAVYDQSN